MCEKKRMCGYRSILFVCKSHGKLARIVRPKSRKYLKNKQGTGFCREDESLCDLVCMEKCSKKLKIFDVEEWVNFY